MADVKFDFSGLKKFQKAFEEAADIGEFRRNVSEPAVKDMAKVYLRAAKMNTPVRTAAQRKRKLPNGKIIRSNTEKMRQKWYPGKLEARGGDVKIEVGNSASYSSYVDNGHRQNVGQYVPILGKRLVANFVEGLHITDKAEDAVQRRQKRIVNKYMNALLKKAMGGEAPGGESPGGESPGGEESGND